MKEYTFKERLTIIAIALLLCSSFYAILNIFGQLVTAGAGGGR